MGIDTATENVYNKANKKIEKGRYLPMRRILSVILAVVMLAALATVFPASAVTPLPQLVITEVNVASYGWSAGGKDSTECFEFVEVLNTGATDVNLYEYAMTMGTAVVGADPSTTTIGNVNPIQQKGPSALNAAGSVCTANYATAPYNAYPTNPDTAILGAGKTAVIWFINADAVTAAYGKGEGVPSALTIEDFKDYYRMDAYNEAAQNDILVVAVDANGGANNATKTSAYTPFGTTNVNAPYNIAGVKTLADDANGFGARFNLWDSNTKVYGIIKTADIAQDAAGVITSTVGTAISYAYVNYNDANVTLNMANDYNNKYMNNNDKGARRDISYNFKYTEVDSDYNNGKTAASSIAYADWDRMNFATPGMLLPSQVTNLVAQGATPNDNVKYVQNRVPTNASSFLYTVYQQNFFGMADSTDSDAILEALGWGKTYYLNNGGTISFAIEGERLIATNLDVDKDSDGVIDATKGDLDSTDGLVTLFPSMRMEKIARSDYKIEYEVTYLDAQENLRYCGVIYNFNEKTSYDIFILRVSGYGNNQRRIASNQYITYDAKDTKYYAANLDTVDGATSIINKISNGEINVKTNTSTSMATFTSEQKLEYAPLLGKTIKVRIEVNQVTGPEFYVNDILVSKCETVLTDANDPTSVVAKNLFWGSQTNYNEFTIGLFVSQRVQVAIDNIKVTGWVNEYTENDILRTYAMAELKEPATGDATIYVAVAMAVSFISLAALVVVKRRKNEN